MAEQHSPQQQAALAEFMASTAPMDQVRENLNPPNGTYDLFIAKLDPSMDDNGLIFFQGEFKILAPAEVAKGPGSSHRERFYIGSKKDPQAKLPETRLNSPGYSRLKGIARVCDVPVNAQPNTQIVSQLVGKSFTCRIETGEDQKNPDGTVKKRGFTNLGRNPVKLGTVPARLDGAAGLANGQAGAVRTATPDVTGATFGTE